MRWFRISLSAVVLVAVGAAFLGLPTEIACRIQPAATWSFLAVVLLTFLWGRFFCSALCPLGIAQSLVNRVFHPRTNVRRVCTRLPRRPVQRVVNAAFLVIALTVGWSALNPYGIFGRAVSLWLPGVVVFALILLAAAFGRGRFWCNWVCPFGTVFDLLSRFAWRKDKVGRHCANCRMCFEKKGTGKQCEQAGVTRRETLMGIAVLAVAENAAVPGLSQREVPVLPPGAIGSADAFARRCVGCQLCVKRCPGECIKPSVSWKSFGTVKLDFQDGYCIENCTRCSEICPAGAIARLSKEQKRRLRIGLAVFHRDRCVRTTNGDQCTACVRKCPKGAIRIVDGFPSVNTELCVGCGACEHVCPATPAPAILVISNSMDSCDEKKDTVRT